MWSWRGYLTSQSFSCVLSKVIVIIKWDKRRCSTCVSDEGGGCGGGDGVEGEWAAATCIRSLGSLGAGAKSHPSFFTMQPFGRLLFFAGSFSPGRCISLNCLGFFPFTQNFQTSILIKVSWFSPTLNCGLTIPNDLPAFIMDSHFVSQSFPQLLRKHFL